jgi:hypothetical protein
MDMKNVKVEKNENLSQSFVEKPCIILPPLEKCKMYPQIMLKTYEKCTNPGEMLKTYPHLLWKIKCLDPILVFFTNLSTLNVDKFVKKCAEMRKHVLHYKCFILKSHIKVC